MTPNKIPNWGILLGILFVVLGSGWLEELDYRDARSDQCSRQGKDYNADADLCVKRIKER